jgi:hypothetical protein
MYASLASMRDERRAVAEFFRGNAQNHYEG